MDHLHFDTDLDLSDAEKAHCVENHLVILAAKNAGADMKSIGREMARLRRLFLESRDFHIIPVPEEQILQKRAGSKQGKAA